MQINQTNNQPSFGVNLRLTGELARKAKAGELAPATLNGLHEIKLIVANIEPKKALVELDFIKPLFDKKGFFRVSAGKIREDVKAVCSSAQGILRAGTSKKEMTPAITRVANWADAEQAKTLALASPQEKKYAQQLNELL